jgi:hypothetical protein
MIIALIIFAAHLNVKVGPTTIVSSKEEIISKPSYEHVLTSVHLSLDSLELEDRSVWTIAPPDAYIVPGWQRGDKVILTPHNSWFSIYKFDYALSNIDRGNYVRVNFASHPCDYQKTARWIINLDTHSNRVFLSDGSSWQIHSDDAALFKSWTLNDFLIYGKNDQLFGTYPFLLINGRLGHCVRAIEF